MANPDPSPATRFVPGCAPGPGRPRTKPLTDRLRARLEEAAGDDGKTVADELVDQWLTSASAGDLGALRELLNRVEGKVVDRIEHDGELTIRVEYADADDRDAEAPSGPEGGA